MKNLIVPNLCRNTSILMVMLVTQLAILVVWLISLGDPSWQSLAIASMYGQWIVISDCFFLCLLRLSIARQPFWLGSLIVILVCLSSVLIVEVASQYALNGFYYLEIDGQRVVRLMLASTIICLLLIRFFMLLETLDSRSKAEAQSRIQALQMRIQPHFLFNSLNTISELAATRPEQAEKAIESLSMLFRAGLENERKRHSLENELALCKRYVELERWRIQDRLNIGWNLLVESPSDWEVPKLIMQPLVENAILHGVESDGRMNIVVDVRESSRHLSLMIENGKDETRRASLNGHGIALDNIRERLFVLYDDDQNLKVKDSPTTHTVIIRFPKQRTIQEAFS